MNATRSPAAQMLANISPAALARTKRPEIQRLADGGQVRHPAEQPVPRAPRTGAALMLSTLPASHVKAKPMEHGGPIHGPGTPTSDSVPIWASKDEFMLPADTTAAVGKHNLQALVDATHTPTRSPAEKMGRLARADGGLIDDQQPGAVTRVGNSYSGGNVTGSIAVNGQAPGGTVSTVDAFRAPPPPAAPPALGAPAAVTPIAPKPAASPMATLPGSTGVAPSPSPNSMQTGGQTSWTGRPPRPSGVEQILSALGQVGQSTQPAPAPAPRAQLSSTNRQIFAGGALGYADGGEIEDPRKQALMNDPGVQLAALTPRQTMATISDAAGGSMPALAEPEMKALPTGPAPYVAEIPYRRDERLPPVEAPAAAAAAAPAAPAPAPAATLPSVAAPDDREMPARRSPAAELGAPAADTTQAPAPMTAQAQMTTLPAARANPLGGMADTQAQIANIQASNATVPQGGATIIDNAASEADRRAQFNEQANLGNALARTSWSPRRGTQVNEAAVAAAMAPIDARARMAQLTVKEAGDTQRAQIAERGTDARARMADVRQQQELGINQQRLGLEGTKVKLDAARDDRAAAAAGPALALAQRKASLQSVVADPSSTPAQRQDATQRLAAMEGRDLRPAPVGYIRDANGNLHYEKGGPADPDTPKSKGALTEDQAKSAGYAVRMENALKVISDVEKTSPGAARPGVGTTLINALPEGAANALRPESRQRVEAAQLDALDAALTLNTGAAYTKEQLHGLSRAYFAQPNDDDKTVIEKQNRLKSLIDTARLRAGASGSAMADAAVSKAAVTAAQSLGTGPAAPVASPQIAELQRRAASDPAVAARLKQLGY